MGNTVFPNSCGVQIDGSKLHERVTFNESQIFPYVGYCVF